MVDLQPTPIDINNFGRCPKLNCVCPSGKTIRQRKLTHSLYRNSLKGYHTEAWVNAPIKNDNMLSNL